MRSGVFFPQNRYDQPINNTPIVEEFEIKDDNGEVEPMRYMGQGYDVDNMRQLGFPNFNHQLAGYEINYNCIGWPFDTDLFIEPELDNTNLVTSNLLEQFINQCIDNYGQNAFPQNGIVNRFRENNAEVADYQFDRNFQENDVVFYFGCNEELENEEPVLLHAARYFDVSRPHGGGQNLQWTSKMGEMLLVSHELEDLMGDVYGDIDLMLV